MLKAMIRLIISLYFFCKRKCSHYHTRRLKRDQRAKSSKKRRQFWCPFPLLRVDDASCQALYGQRQHVWKRKLIRSPVDSHKWRRLWQSGSVPQLCPCTMKAQLETEDKHCPELRGRGRYHAQPGSLWLAKVQAEVGLLTAWPYSCLHVPYAAWLPKTKGQG